MKIFAMFAVLHIYTFISFYFYRKFKDERDDLDSVFFATTIAGIIFILAFLAIATIDIAVSK